MPSRRGLEQAMTWLRSKMAEKDTLDAVNAEVTYHVILDLQHKRRLIGALYHQSHTAKKEAEERVAELEARKEAEWDGIRRIFPVEACDPEVREIVQEGLKRNGFGYSEVDG